MHTGCQGRLSGCPCGMEVLVAGGGGWRRAGFMAGCGAVWARVGGGAWEQLGALALDASGSGLESGRPPVHLKRTWVTIHRQGTSAHRQSGQTPDMLTAIRARRHSVPSRLHPYQSTASHPTSCAGQALR